MKRSHWHVAASRLAAQNPHWSWSQVCATLARRKPARRTKPTVEGHTKRMEQLKLFAS